MRLLCNGYINEHAGSVASASHLVLRELLRRGHAVVFVSKRTFVHPADLLAEFPNLTYVNATNVLTNRLYEHVGRRLGVAGVPLGQLNHHMYARTVLSVMRTLASQETFDGVLYLGLPAFGRVGDLSVVSWVQGAPGTDVRSLDKHHDLLTRTEGRLRLALLKAYGRYRLSAGLPDFTASDRIIVGSRMSAEVLARDFGVPRKRITALAYPMDLSRFTPREGVPCRDGPLDVLWLGRIVPRKRLDLLLDAAALALSKGIPLKLHIVGRFGFTPGLKALLDAFPHQDVVTCTPKVPRAEVPDLLRRCDVLAQPSDEEDFGSSIAEAMACGTPVIAGHTNGTADYLCPKSFHLPDDHPETLAAVLAECYERKQTGTLVEPVVTRATAERMFDVSPAADAVERMFRRKAAAH